MAKKVGAIVSLAIIGVLIVATIIMANINIDYGIKCETPDVVYVQTSSGGSLKVSEEDKNTIVEYINEASKQKVLTALFNGELNNKAIVTSKNQTFSSPTSYYVRYKYYVAQTLMEGNKPFEDIGGNVFSYEELVFVVNNAKGELEVKVYVVPDSTQSNNYTHYYTLKADFTKLYAFLTENY